MIDEQQRREDAWAVMKQMHEDLTAGPRLVAAQGWCAPSSANYGPSFQVGIYRQVNALGQVVIGP